MARDQGRTTRLYMGLMEAADSQPHYRSLAKGLLVGKGLLPLEAIMSAMDERKATIATLIGLYMIEGDTESQMKARALIAGLQASLDHGRKAS